MLELLIAIGILVIIVVVSIVSFNSANKMSELRRSTDEFADMVKDAQILSVSNIKEAENPVGYESFPYELGYIYNFSTDSSVIGFQEILSSGLSIENGNLFFYDLANKNLFENHEIIAIETEDSGGSKTSYDNFHVAFLFPEGEIIFYPSDIQVAETAEYFNIYIKHDKVDDWQGKITINQYSGRVTSEIISYP